MIPTVIAKRRTIYAGAPFLPYTPQSLSRVMSETAIVLADSAPPKAMLRTWTPSTSQGGQLYLFGVN